MSEEGQVTTERRGQVLLIGLDRPAKRNAITPELFSAAGQAYLQLDQDDDLRCAVLFAQGDHFCAGIDLMKFAPAMANGQLTLPEDALDPVGLFGPRLRKPVVSAVQGVCVGIGIELILATEIRVADSTARFAQIEVRRGLYPAGGATMRFPQETGWGNAMRYLLTGEEFGAEEARRIGLVQEVVAPGAQVERAIALAELIAAQAPLGVRATLASARLALMAGEEAAKQQLQSEFIRLLQSEDAQEGARSFFERRPPRFQGRQRGVTCIAGFQPVFCGRPTRATGGPTRFFVARKQTNRSDEDKEVHQWLTNQRFRLMDICAGCRRSACWRMGPPY